MASFGAAICGLRSFPQAPTVQWAPAQPDLPFAAQAKKLTKKYGCD